MEAFKIEGDEELAKHPAVRGGDGSPDDPYRISDLLVIQDQVYGLWLANVTSHVVIQNVIVDGSKLATTETVRCTTDTGDCGLTRGLFLNNVTDATVRDVRLEDQFWGVLVSESGSVNMKRVELGFPATRTLNPLSNETATATTFTRGFDVSNTGELALENVTIGDARVTFSARNMERLELTNTEFNGRSSEAIVQNVREVEVSQSVFSKVQLLVEEQSENVTIVGSKFAESPGVAMRVHARTDAPSVELIRVCGSFIQKSTGNEALDLSRTKRVEVIGATFEDTGGGIQAPDASEGIEVRHSSITNTSGPGLLLKGSGMEVHNNSIAGNGDASILEAHEWGNASHNWWGDPDGPDIKFEEGPGDGDDLWPPVNVTFRPFLSGPPETGPSAVDCRGSGTDPGVKAEPSIPVAAHAGVGIEHTVNVNEKIADRRVKEKAKVKAEAEASIGPVAIPTDPLPE